MLQEFKQTRSIRSRYAVIACAVALFFLGTKGYAQARYAVLAQSTVGEVSGLRIVTIRDNLMSACYTLFIFEPHSLSAVPVPTPVDDATEQSLRRVREAAEKRDRKIGELNARTKVLGPVDPLDTYDAARRKATYEDERRKIDDEYEQLLRTEIPGSYPWATALPGTRSGSSEDVANAMRRAMLDPNPTSETKTMTKEFAQLGDLLRQLIEVPRMAASGPVACTATVR